MDVRFPSAALVCLICLLAAGPAAAGDLRAAEAQVLGAYRFAPVPASPDEIQVRRLASVRARIDRLGLADETLAPDLDKVDVVLGILGAAPDDESLLGGVGRVARRVKRLLQPTEDIRLRVKIDPVDDEYRLAVRVRF